MALRAILLSVLTVGLFLGTARAKDEPILLGSSLKTEDAVLQSAVFVGKLISLGERDNSTDHASIGPEYPNAKVKVSQNLKENFDDSKFVGIYLNMRLKEETPVEGNLYIFFIKYESNAATTFIVCKLLTASAENISAVEKLISK